MKTIPLLNSDRVVQVDDQDYEYLSQFHWSLNPYGYPTRKQYLRMENGKCKYLTVFMHRMIVDRPEGMHTDHIDGDKLNNQRSNLRVCTPQQNWANSGPTKRNTSGYRGVSFCKQTNRWRAQLSVGRRSLNIGRFDTAEEAARSWNAKALELHGEYVRLNPV